MGNWHKCNTAYTETVDCRINSIILFVVGQSSTDYISNFDFYYKAGPKNSINKKNWKQITIAHRRPQPTLPARYQSK